MEYADFDHLSIDRLFEEFDRHRNDVLQISLETLTEGQILMEHVKELGSLMKSTNQHSTVAACYEVEHILGVHHEDRRKFDEEWEKYRQILNEYIQMSEIKRDIDQVEMTTTTNPCRE